MIEVVGETKLLNASPDGEALLFACQKEIKQVEARAMRVLQVHLPEDQLQKLLNNIVKIKARETQTLIERVSAKFRASKISTYPRLSFLQRGKTAGTAHLQKWEIRLNPILLSENKQQFINDVIPHEYAHLLVYALFGKVAPHGREWRWMMETILSQPAQRTHQFDTANSSTRQYQRFTYQCACQTHELTIIRHKRVLSGKAQYHCKKCGEIIQYIEKSDMDGGLC